MAYSSEDKAAFKAKDERITRTAAFNNVVALRVAEADAFVKMGKTEEAVKLLDINSMFDSIDDLVFPYLFDGTRPAKKGKCKAKKKDDSGPALPEPNDQQAEVLDTIASAFGCDVEKLKAEIIKEFGRYPINVNSIDKIKEKVNLEEL